MISAKDEFFLEREMIQELKNLIYSADLSQEEREIIDDRINGQITSDEFDKIVSDLYTRQINPLVAVREGKLLLMKDVNKAVKKAADSE